jgi:hypothetical protein
MPACIDKRTQRSLHRVGAAEMLPQLGFQEHRVLIAGPQLRIAMWLDASAEVDLGNLSE